MDLPKEFTDRIALQFGNEADAFLQALKDKAPVSIRLNPAKHNIIKGSPVAWCSSGLYLDERPSFTLDPLFHAGCYYVQEASSMFLEEIFGQLKLNEQKLLVLDACASPGGKSTHLASLINKDSLLVSNEVISSRATVLKENIIKWGTGNIIITNNDPSSFSQLNGLFDVIVVDAPCSGEGLFRKDKEAIEEWSEQNCDFCVSRQQRILSALLPALKQNGILIYCTCTYNPRENEDNVKLLIREHGMESIPLKIQNEWGIAEVGSENFSAYSFYPHRTRSEGFFISVLQKKKYEDVVSLRTNQKRFQPLMQKHSNAKELVTGRKEDLFVYDNDIYLLPSSWINLFEFLSRSLKIKYAGTRIAEIKSDDLIPAHDLALSIHLNRDSFPSVNLNREEALKYLRKEDFKKEIPEKGWLLAMYETTPLGWIKSLGTRFNNYYPVEWRIRMR